jgi:hypothetical protein
MGSTGRNWEGLGGPVRVDRANLDDIDPSLDECCQREEESNRKGNALRRTLQRYDVVAEKERRRRQLVNTTNFSGCRCCYDPNSDGGEYLALIELRTSRKQKEEDAEETEHEAMEEKKKDDTVDVASDPSDDEFDYLLDEELPGQGEELKALEDLRRAELEMSIFSREVALSHGYGTHRQMHPTRVLKAAGLAPGTRDPSPAVVLHLVDPDSIASASLDLYLEELAQKEAKGTKFLRSGGRSTLLMDAELATKVLPRLKPEKDMPAMVAIRDGVATNVCPRLQGLTDRDGQIVPRAVYEWLDRCGVLLEHPPLLEAVCRIQPEEEALMDCLTSPKPTPPEEPRFDCGVHECCKTFPHEHIGIQNEQQDGLVISEADVVG